MTQRVVPSSEFFDLGDVQTLESVLADPENESELKSSRQLVPAISAKRIIDLENSVRQETRLEANHRTNSQAKSTPIVNVKPNVDVKPILGMTTVKQYQGNGKAKLPVLAKPVNASKQRPDAVPKGNAKQILIAKTVATKRLLKAKPVDNANPSSQLSPGKNVARIIIHAGGNTNR